MKIQAYAATKAKASLEPFQYQAPTLGPNDVQIKITHCGICHSDVHIIDDDWRIGFFPAVPGHEIVGIVEEKGSSVSHIDVGARVGIGWQRSSCLQCEQCVSGFEQHCPHQQATCAGNFGGYADRIRIDSRFAFSIPSTLRSEIAAPLLCGGVTVFTPFESIPIRPEHHIGIIGMGGLGHMAIQFAHHWGCEVTVFSTSASKEVEAMKLGANHFVATESESALSPLKWKYDVLLATAPVDLNWKAYVAMLKPEGTLCMVGAAPGPLNVNVFDLISGSRKIRGSAIGSRQTIERMLKFAARHEIGAQVEVLPMSRVNEALVKVRENKARYRIVLRNED